MAYSNEMNKNNVAKGIAIGEPGPGHVCAACYCTEPYPNPDPSPYPYPNPDPPPYPYPYPYPDPRPYPYPNPDPRPYPYPDPEDPTIMNTNNPMSETMEKSMKNAKMEKKPNYGGGQ